MRFYCSDSLNLDLIERIAEDPSQEFKYDPTKKFLLVFADDKNVYYMLKGGLNCLKEVYIPYTKYCMIQMSNHHSVFSKVRNILNAYLGEVNRVLT